MTVKIEYRTSSTLRAAPEAAYELSGLAAAYDRLSGDLGGFKERIAPGAFSRALASNSDVICCVNHDPSMLLGRTKSGTLKLADSKEGLRFICKLDPNQQSHRDIHSAVKRGDLADCSFAFNIDGDGEQWDDAKDERGQRFNRRTLTNLRLHDVSVVCHPAYPGSTSVSARSAVRQQVASLEDLYLAKTGREYVDLRQRLAVVGAEISNEARQMAEDMRLRERVEALGRALQVEEMLAEIQEELGL